MEKSNFREWTLEKVELTFGLVQVSEMDALETLLSYEFTPNEHQIYNLTELSKNYIEHGGDDWNEIELENKLISPVIVASGIDNKKFAYFLERELSTTIDEYELSGKVDGMIATGFRSPRMPYFCLNEYKRGTDPYGDPRGQALIAMLVAQKLNNNGSQNAERPIYGSYIIGRNWYFMALVGKEYAISKDFSCVDDEIFDIFRILKSLRVQIEKIL
ncbi:hypothetical protein LV89_00294 [Arcicella aurantiaca]|uniref:Uncharacterized protein n=1 Tax=Arcicella aurantiaca TaxID=591202 RepID=A0A316EHB3_9BACT|nr:hypothetical protein [Arcicella aurantiaca]PWK29454.1 hypothetical protein LV89_00294 [Arcicella aurantiaca]